MLQQNVTAKPGFRELTANELEAVGGGADIIVTGDPDAEPSSAPLSSSLAGYMLWEAAKMQGAMDHLFENAHEEAPVDDVEHNPDGFVDENGDGLDDVTGEGKPIVVTAERVELGDGYHAYILADGHYDIFKEVGWFASLFKGDDFVGHYVADADGNFRIADPETSDAINVTVPISGVPVTTGGETTTTPQTGHTFSPAPPGTHYQ